MKYIKIVLLIICVAVLGGCSMNRMQEKTVFAMDTVMTLKAYGKNAQAALDEAQQEIYRLDLLLDRYDGEFGELNFVPEVQVSDDTAELVRLALEMCEKTDGAFDITIAPIMDAWGFYQKEFTVPSEKQISSLLEFVGYENIEVNGNTLFSKNGATLDLGGIAKGYTSARIREIFEKHDIKSGLISLGGNVETVGKRPDGREWNVAIQDPENSEGYIGTVKSQNCAVITSGDYQRCFEENGQKYHHIIDPDTGYPAQSGLSSVTIISNDATEADALSTALFVMGMKKGIDYWRNNGGFEVIFIKEDGKIYITEGVDFESEREYEIIEKRPDLK